jgi:hypothetical protein
MHIRALAAVAACLVLESCAAAVAPDGSTDAPDAAADVASADAAAEVAPPDPCAPCADDGACAPWPGWRCVPCAVGTARVCADPNTAPGCAATTTGAACR